MKFDSVQKPYDFVVAVIAAMYIVQAVSSLRLFGRLSDLGIRPRDLRSLPGVFSAPWLHSGFLHLMSNTVPGAILACLMLWQSPRAFVAATFSGVVIGGAAAWLLARRSVHVGASSLVYAYFGYLLTAGYFNHGLVVVSLMVWIVFGRLLRGVFPQGQGISFEGHLFGLAAGVLAAWQRPLWATSQLIVGIADWLSHNSLSLAALIAASVGAAAVPIGIGLAVRGTASAQSGAGD